MRVLLATPGTDVGGAERVVITLAHELPSRGYEVVLWGPAGALEPELEGAAVHRIVVPPAGARPPASSRASRASPARCAARIRRSCMPTTRASPRWRSSPRAWEAGRACSQPSTACATPSTAPRRGCCAAPTPWPASPRISSPGLRAAGLPAARLRVVPNSVSLPAARDPAADARLDAELGLDGAPVVVAIGRLAKQKNHARFLAAAARVAEVRPDVRFLLVGDGPLRAELADQARSLRLDGRVTLTGVRHDVPAIAARADLVVFSSDWEGLSLVALEALAAGTPVLSTPVEGMRDLLEGGAVTVTGAATPADLAGGMIDLLADPAGWRSSARVAASSWRRVTPPPRCSRPTNGCTATLSGPRTTAWRRRPWASAVRPFASRRTEIRAVRRSVTLRWPTRARLPFWRSTTVTSRLHGRALERQMTRTRSDLRGVARNRDGRPGGGRHGGGGRVTGRRCRRLEGSHDRLEHRCGRRGRSRDRRVEQDEPRVRSHHRAAGGGQARAAVAAAEAHRHARRGLRVDEHDAALEGPAVHAAGDRGLHARSALPRS